MKPSEYIDKTLNEATAHMPSTPEERNAYQKGIILQMKQIDRDMETFKGNPIHVKQLKAEWDRLNRMYLASFDRSEPKNEDAEYSGKGKDKGQLIRVQIKAITDPEYVNAQWNVPMNPDKAKWKVTLDFTDSHNYKDEFVVDTFDEAIKKVITIKAQEDK